MPNKCIICKVSRDKSLNRAMHRFPDDKNLRKAWIDALCLTEDLFLFPNIYLCSDHFQDSDFNVHSSGARTLKTGAVPSRTCISEPSDHSDLSPISKKPKMSSSLSISSTSSVLPGVSEESESYIITFNKPAQRPRKRPIKDHSSSSTTVTAPETLSLEEQITSSKVPQKDSSETITASSETEELRKRSKARKRKCLAYIRDLRSPRRAKVCFNLAKSKALEQRKKIQNLQRSNRRLKSKVTDLQSLLSHLWGKNYIITESAETTIEASLPGRAADIMKRILNDEIRKKNSQLRSFALTLNFYSPAAYKYIRERFNKSLPHPTTLQKW